MNGRNEVINGVSYEPSVASPVLHYMNLIPVIRCKPVPAGSTVRCRMPTQADLQPTLMAVGVQARRTIPVCWCMK